MAYCQDHQEWCHKVWINRVAWDNTCNQAVQDQWCNFQWVCSRFDNGLACSKCHKECKDNGQCMAYHRIKDQWASCNQARVWWADLKDHSYRIRMVKAWCVLHLVIEWWCMKVRGGHRLDKNGIDLVSFFVECSLSGWNLINRCCFSSIWFELPTHGTSTNSCASTLVTLLISRHTAFTNKKTLNFSRLRYRTNKCTTRITYEPWVLSGTTERHDASSFWPNTTTRPIAPSKPPTRPTWSATAIPIRRPGSTTANANKWLTRKCLLPAHARRPTRSLHAANKRRRISRDNGEKQDRIEQCHIKSSNGRFNGYLRLLEKGKKFSFAEYLFFVC